MANEDRKSEAEIPSLLKDPQKIAEKEAANGLVQFDAVAAEIVTGIERGELYKLRPSTILSLHKIATDGIERFAGNWRPGAVKIGKSNHEPPHASLVPELVEELCDFVNEHWSSSAVELSAYVLWQICWIHPFTDGNGRTARAVAYLVLCISLGMVLPGRNTIPEQISVNKKPYYDALEKADEAFKNGKVDVSELSKLLSDLLANQLLTVHSLANECD